MEQSKDKHQWYLSILKNDLLINRSILINLRIQFYFIKSVPALSPFQPFINAKSAVIAVSMMY